MSEWQPIETAPKDGTRIIATDDSDIVVVIYWSNMDWLVSWDHDKFDEDGTQPPTHWMPLPEPPQ